MRSARNATNRPGLRPARWHAPWASRCGGSAARIALGFDIECIDRLAGGHEQAVPLAAAEAEVGAAFRQQDAADQRAIGGEDRHAILARATGEGGPDIARGIA